jgi:cellulose biosynthesis protein BcsQ
VLPARETDTAFDYASKYHARDGYHAADSLKPILEAVKDDFDVIVIDTPPVLNEAAFGAHYLATTSIIPLRASQNDRDSTGKYAKQLPALYKKMHERGHQGYDAVLLTTMNVTETSRSETQFVSELTSMLSADILPRFKTSEAVRACADSFKTIFELNPSEYGKIEAGRTALGSREQLSNAHDNVIAIAKEVEKVLNSVWENQRKKAGQLNEEDQMLEEL